MGKKNEGNFRKISDKIFKQITRKKAKERINNEFKEYIKKEEKQIGEKLTKEESKELRQEFFATRGKKIIEEEAKKARGKATILALVGTLGIGGVGGYALGTYNSKIPGITDGKESIKIDMNEVEKDVEIDNVLQQDKHDIFVKELQDAALNGEVENTDSPEQDQTQEEKIAEEIKELNSAEKIDAYLANIYIEAYEQQTGDESLKTSDIRISENNESYVYILDDGRLVSHGEFPYETEKQIEADGKGHDEVRNDVKTYTVELVETNKTIDEMTDKLEKVIPGENYTDMKDYDSVLVDMGKITQNAFRLKELLKELEKDSNNEYIKGLYENTQNELVEAVGKFYEGKDIQTIEESQIQESAEDERGL